jgi:hypothetical protein
VLGLDRSAAAKEIKLAYQESLILLHPPEELMSVMPASTRTRIQAAHERVDLSFGVLGNFGKRVEYDNSLVRRVSRPLPVALPERESGVIVAADQPNGGSNRRKSNRYSLSLPAQVTGVDRMSGIWTDSAQTLDVSRRGVALKMQKCVRHGSVLHLSLPLPARLRIHGQSGADYEVYALVRRMEPTKGGARTVGLEFLGHQAPPGYQDCPWASFRTDRWDGTERRREPRERRSEVLSVEYFDDSMQHIRQEVALTEDVSRSGARVYLKAAPPEFNIVKVTNLDRTFESLAAVCNRFVGKDGFERLCLRFLDRKWMA